MENIFFRWLSSSIGKKVVMALTGLFLVVFLTEHLYTNLLLYAGDGGARFDAASDDMVHTLLVRIVEVVLFGAILVHVLQALRLTNQNSAARPKKYAVDGTSQTSSWFSRNMLQTGGVISFFVIVHLKNFFLPYRIQGIVGDADGQITLARCVADALANPWYAALYLFGVLCLGLHLNHGFQSALQTLGLSDRKYALIWKATGSGVALLFGLGFASFPISFFVANRIGFDLLGWNL